MVIGLVAKGLSVFQNEIQDRTLLGEPLLEILSSRADRTASKETFEYGSWVGFGGHWRSRRLPGNVVLISAGVPGVIAPGFDRYRRSTPRKESVFRLDFVGDDLIDGHPSLNIFASGFPSSFTCQEGKLARA